MKEQVTVEQEGDEFTYKLIVNDKTVCGAKTGLHSLLLDIKTTEGEEKKGYAKKLLIHIEKIAREQNAKTMKTSDIDPCNYKAICFFKSMNYRLHPIERDETKFLEGKKTFEKLTNENKETIFTELINRTLAKMPSEFATWVRKKIDFEFPKKEGNLACTVSKNDSKHYQAVICLFDEFLTEEEAIQEHSLLHEIAHVKLKHTKQSNAEKNRKQEEEADALARKWWPTAHFGTEETTKKLKWILKRVRQSQPNQTRRI